MKEGENVKKDLLSFCERKGFDIYKSFSVVSQEDDLLFVNASITPFKDLFLKEEYVEKNIALIQKCIRMGGRAYSLKEINESNYCNTFFEMLGLIFFNSNYYEVMAILFELLEYMKIDKDRFYFAIPFDNFLFEKVLLENRIKIDRIFKIDGNNIFWTKWRFGKESLVGEGITLIYSRDSKEMVNSAEQLLYQEDIFIPLLNVIDINAREENGIVKKIRNQGFEIAMGIERLLAIKQECNHYEIDLIRDQFKCVENFFEKGYDQFSQVDLKVITDHLRTIGVLITEKVIPYKNKQGYVLRKMIRTVMEIVFIKSGKIDINDLLINFYKIDYQDEEIDNIIEIIHEEKMVFRNNIEKFVKRFSSIKMSEKQIRETYGISSNLLKKIREMQ
ncbi:MAG: alanine--tRNA ligase-related protein [Candidatus Paceibacterota bacterium]